MNGTKDWTFKDEKLAQNFDNHVREQLPWYDFATQATAFITRSYAPKNGLIYDIGASTGNIGKALTPLIEERDMRFFAIEESEELADNYKGGIGKLIIDDAMDVEYEPFDVAIFFLSFMFMPVNKRGKFLDDLMAKCNYGGAIILVEKMEAEEGYAGTTIRRLTMDWKMQNAVKPADIVAKELQLCGIQRPVMKQEMPFNAVEFFRLGEFAGYILEKR